MNKKSQRDDFRNSVFKRDRNSCIMCGYIPADISELDAHHITDRDKMPFGGYVLQNGITLCTDRSRKDDCHQKAERFHATGISILAYTPNDLYVKIRSSYKLAYYQSLRLGLSDIDAKKIMDRIEELLLTETKQCQLLEVNPDSTTWKLACDEQELCHVTLYGEGRYADDRTERCSTTISSKSG